MDKSYGRSVLGSGPAYELFREHGRRVVSFGLAGVLGACTTLGGTVLLYHHLYLPLWLASGLAIQTAILVTFTINSLFTWADRPGARSWRRFATFEGVSLVGLVIQEMVLAVGVDRMHFFYLLVLVVGIGVASIWNYLVNNRVTFALPALISA